MKKMNARRRRACGSLVVGIVALAVVGGLNCPPDPGEPPIYNNTTDPTNGGATYITSLACSSCHPDYAAIHNLHAHAHKLTPATIGSPGFPPEATTAGVPNPPNGFEWTDIAYLIGGYAKKALFIGQDGYILTTGLTGQPTQWNLTFPPNGTLESFDVYDPGAVAPRPYDFEAFRHDTTGPVPQDPAQPMFQDNRPGILGTWAEAGVMCESCHGPGSKHIPNPGARNIFVDLTGAQTCNQCHSRPYGSTTGEIPATGGFIQDQCQNLELRASGGHSSFDCAFCHDPHYSVALDPAKAIRNDCTACHADANMALHAGKVFRRGDYEEPLTCISCHMPFASLNGSQATPAVVGTRGRMGDTRTHIFRISTDSIDYTSFLMDGGTKVALDAEGRAAVTVDFVCLRCHNEVTTPTLAFTVERAAEIAKGLHLPFGN